VYTFLVQNKLPASDKIYVGESKIPSAGRGVFATKNIKKGELIERCPIIEVSKNDSLNLKTSILVTYLFYFGKKKEKLAIALGFGSIYNHSFKSKAKFIIKPKEKIIDFIALEDIERDEEITFNYKGSNNLKEPLWFENGKTN